MCATCFSYSHHGCRLKCFNAKSACLQKNQSKAKTFAPKHISIAESAEHDYRSSKYMNMKSCYTNDSLQPRTSSAVSSKPPTPHGSSIPPTNSVFPSLVSDPQTLSAGDASETTADLVTAADPLIPKQLESSYREPPSGLGTACQIIIRL